MKKEELIEYISKTLNVEPNEQQIKELEKYIKKYRQGVLATQYMIKNKGAK